MKIIQLVLGLVVGILLMTGLIIPMATEAATTEKTFTNSGTYFMTDDDDYTLVYDPTGKFIVNGENILFTDITAGLRTTIVSTEEWLIRFANDGNVGYSLSVVVGEGDVPSNEICKADNAGNTTFAFSNGTLTISGNKTATYTYTPESFRGIAKEGAYVMTAANTPAKINSTTTIIVGNGTTQVGHWYDRFYIVGTVENMNVTAPEGITVSDVEVNTTPVNGYVDLVELTSITFSATDGENDVDATYNRVIVPKEITAELSQHLNPSEIALLSATVIIGLVALIAYAAYSIRGREFD